MFAEKKRNERFSFILMTISSLLLLLLLNVQFNEAEIGPTQSQLQRILAEAGLGSGGELNALAMSPEQEEILKEMSTVYANDVQVADLERELMNKLGASKPHPSIKAQLGQMANEHLANSEKLRSLGEQLKRMAESKTGSQQ